MAAIFMALGATSVGDVVHGLLRGDATHSSDAVCEASQTTSVRQ